MTATAATPTGPVNPDDRCGVCDETREYHGDKHHLFSTDGALIPIKPGEPPRQTPPTAEGQRLLRDPTTALNLRLIERLIQKSILSGEDLVYIFGGGSAPATGSSEG